MGQSAMKGVSPAIGGLPQEAQVKTLGPHLHLSAKPLNLALVTPLCGVTHFLGALRLGGGREFAGHAALQSWISHCGTDA